MAWVTWGTLACAWRLAGCYSSMTIADRAGVTWVPKLSLTWHGRQYGLGYDLFLANRALFVIWLLDLIGIAITYKHWFPRHFWTDGAQKETEFGSELWPGAYPLWFAHVPTAALYSFGLLSFNGHPSRTAFGLLINARPIRLFRMGYWL